MGSPPAGRGNVKRTDSETEAAEDATQSKRKRALEGVTSDRGGVGGVPRVEGFGLARVSIIECRQMR